jgi:hypothetical protein
VSDCNVIHASMSRTACLPGFVVARRHTATAPASPASPPTPASTRYHPPDVPCQSISPMRNRFPLQLQAARATPAPRRRRATMHASAQLGCRLPAPPGP